MFGPPKGPKTLGRVVKVGSTQVVVKQLVCRTSRGVVKEAGENWTVPFDMCSPATEKDIRRALGPTQAELAQMGTTVSMQFRPSPYTPQLFKLALAACEAIAEASIYWTDEDEKRDAKLKVAQEAAGRFLDQAQAQGIRHT